MEHSFSMAPDGQDPADSAAAASVQLRVLGWGATERNRLSAELREAEVCGCPHAC